MKFSSDVIRESVLDQCSDPENDIEFVESSGWKNEGKYDHCYYIFKHGGKFYKVSDSRTGSYYSEYYYTSREDWGDEVECAEVERQEVVTHKWVPVEKK